MSTLLATHGHPVAIDLRVTRALCRAVYGVQFARVEIIQRDLIRDDWFEARVIAAGGGPLGYSIFGTSAASARRKLERSLVGMARRRRAQITRAIGRVRV